MSREFKFSKRTINAIEPPEKDRIYVRDTGQPGLNICVSSTDVRTFYACKTIDRRYVRYRLGTTAELSVEKARKLCQKYLGELVSGKRPHREKRAARESLTFGETHALWIENSKGKRRPRTTEEYTRVESRYLSSIRDRLLADIEPVDMLQLHQRIGKRNGHIMANHALCQVKACFNFARKHLKIALINPVAGLEMYPEKSRDRFLLPEEVPKFFAGLEAVNQTYRDFFALCLWTAQRRGNLEAMKWKDIDFKRKLWTLHGDETKNHEPQNVPLTPPALEILESRRGNHAIWVFPNPSDSSGHVREPQRLWRKVLAEGGLEDLRIHDLRRTLPSWLASDNVGLPIIAKLLGHKSLSSTQVYARLSLAPVTDVVEQQTEKLLTFVQ